jgi:hypothetical protein
MRMLKRAEARAPDAPRLAPLNSPKISLDAIS